MSRRHATAALAAALLALAGPAQASEPSQPPAQPDITLAFQAHAKPADAGQPAVQFVGYADTRCPSDVTCAWAGEARAFFWLTGGGLKPQVITLAWNGCARHDTGPLRTGPWLWCLVSLEPRPLVNGRVNPADYQAVLRLWQQPARR